MPFFPSDGVGLTRRMTGAKPGRIDKSISGNLINKFGKNLPIPFIESVDVLDDGLDVTLSMYYSVTDEQLENLNLFITSILASEINVYFMLLVESNIEDIRFAALADYDYKKFLQNLNKNTPPSHIINYLSCYFHSKPVTLKPSIGFGYTGISRGLPVGFTYPLSKAEYARVIEGRNPDLPRTTGAYIIGSGRYDNPSDMTNNLRTNAYSVPINTFIMSEMVYSREGTPIVKLSARKQIGQQTLKNIQVVNMYKPSGAGFISELIVYNNEGIAENGFFGSLNYVTHGIQKMGLVSFSTLFTGLESGETAKGLKAEFNYNTSNINFYKSFVSDISHVSLMEQGKVITSDTTIFEDINKNLVESSDVIRSINSEFYANDKIKLSEILEGFNELIVETPENNEAQILINSLSYILSEFGNSMNLLPELNKFRSQIPNRPTTTQEGRFYENVKIKIYNANQVVMQGRKLKRLVIKNPIVKDLRDPLIARDEYRVREDVLMKTRALGKDLSTKYPSVDKARLEGRKNDFIPFIYLHGHEIQGQVNIDPTFNPMSTPASFMMPPYGASTEMGTFTYMGSNAYDLIIKTMEAYFSKMGTYGYATTDPRFSERTDIINHNADKYSSFENFAGSELASINEFLKKMIGESRSENVYFDWAEGNYNIDWYSDRLNTIERPNENNNFTLIENGHFSFDYEKALGLYSNISLGLNTNKIDLLFGRDLLQSKFKVIQARVDVHAKLVSTGQKAEYDHLDESNYTTYDGSPVFIEELEDSKVPHSHLLLGSIIANFDRVGSGNPITTKCTIKTPKYLENISDYRTMVNERMAGFANESDHLGKFLDYNLHKNFVQKSVLTGYTFGKPSAGSPLQYNTYYNQTVLVDDAWDNTIFDLSTGDTYTKFDKAFSYIALRNIGSLYNTSFGSPNSVMRQYSHTTGFLAPITDNYGETASISFTKGEITEDKFAEYVAYHLRNQSKFTPIANAINAPDYRLMTFEFQKVGKIDESILETADGLGAGGFANIVAFKLGILPEQVEKYLNRQFYEFQIMVEDNTYGVYLTIKQDLKEAKKVFNEYLSECSAHCSYNDLTKAFNDFFVDGIEAKYSEKPELAPWVRAPLLYAIHQELLFNAFDGDLLLLKNYALSLSQQLNPRTGNLKSIQVFYAKMNKLWSDYYSPTGLVDKVIETRKGPVIMRFGSEYNSEKTSGYTMMGNPYTFTGYSADYKFDLHSGFSISARDVGDSYISGPGRDLLVADEIEVTATAGSSTTRETYTRDRY